ncbi:protein C1orf43 homolog [Macrosteles quadrilineatus]|uniref:protein C1orf43 homolog n=1 Tax=Macrosteles quadrilineatus TaxID=74068 RepID=UPI0023E1EB1E|nr:protein C1orf43 homolog [Macrosteles quadrilineatus]
MTQELSGVTVVFIVSSGILTFILLFIFAKRQIMRFALRSRRGPHVPIGHGAKKSLKKEIHRRIDAIPKIVYEPRMISESDSQYIMPPDNHLPPFYCRLKAMDDVKLLEQEITKQDPCLHRHPTENLRAYLLMTLAAPLNGLGQRMVHQFCDLYEHARHDPSEFGDEEYQVFHRLLLKLIDAARLLKSYSNSRKSSPNRTPLKKSQDKCRQLLEAKLKEKRDEDSPPVPPPPDNNETSV